MKIENLTAGANPPHEINCIVEIPAGGGPVKYEFDKDAACIAVDRFMGTAMHYPANYGFVPHTLGDDGDALDVLVVTPVPLISGSVIACRPLAMLDMEDESGLDSKILAVPTTKILPLYKDMKDVDDLPPTLRAEIGHFFEQYKANEAGKWAKVSGWRGRVEAEKAIEKALAAIK